MNKPIVIAGFIIGGGGVVTVLSGKGNANLMRVFVGTYVFVLVLSFSELVPPLKPIAGGLATVAAIAALLYSMGPLWDAIRQAIKVK